MACDVRRTLVFRQRVPIGADAVTPPKRAQAVGIIPTHVGSTLVVRIVTVPSGDHPLGFACTDYVCELEEHEQSALRSAIGEVLTEQCPRGDVGPLVDAAMDGRICDISCMDAAGYVDAMGLPRLAPATSRADPRPSS